MGHAMAIQVQNTFHATGNCTESITKHNYSSIPLATSITCLLTWVTLLSRIHQSTYCLAAEDLNIHLPMFSSIISTQWVGLPWHPQKESASVCLDLKWNTLTGRATFQSKCYLKPQAWPLLGSYIKPHDRWWRFLIWKEKFLFCHCSQ